MSPSRCLPDPGTPAPSRDPGRRETGRFGRRRWCGGPSAAPRLPQSEPERACILDRGSPPEDLLCMIMGHIDASTYKEESKDPGVLLPYVGQGQPPREFSTELRMTPRA